MGGSPETGWRLRLGQFLLFDGIRFDLGLLRGRAHSAVDRTVEAIHAPIQWGSIRRTDRIEAWRGHQFLAQCAICQLHNRHSPWDLYRSCLI